MFASVDEAIDCVSFIFMSLFSTTKVDLPFTEIISIPSNIVSSLYCLYISLDFTCAFASTNTNTFPLTEELASLVEFPPPITLFTEPPNTLTEAFPLAGIGTNGGEVSLAIDISIV